MNCTILKDYKFYNWKEVSLVDEFNDWKCSKFKIFVAYLSTNMNIKLQENFLSSIKTKYNSLTYGGFLENRVKLIGFLEKENNNMTHLGIDINNLKPGDRVSVPCDCEVVHVLRDDSKLNGWGGRIIFKLDESVSNKIESEYLLYGHLSQKTLPTVGQKFKSGDIVGHLGDYNENGGWFIHLHVQCIKKCFFEMYKNNLENLDGYWFQDIDYTSLVSDPTNLVFEKFKF